MRHSIFLVALVLGLNVGLSRADAPSPVASRAYRSTQEFITVREFLVGHPELSLSEPQIQELAFFAAGSGEGAAKRLIQGLQLVLKAELPGKKALDLGKRLAAQTQVQADQMLDVFRYSYAVEGFDLNAQEALEFTDRLIQKLSEDHPRLSLEVKEMSRFCGKKGGLELPKARCLERALDWIPFTSPMYGMRDRTLASQVEEWMDWTRSDDAGPKFTYVRAIQEASMAIPSGVFWLSNWMTAFKYARKELKLGLEPAVALTRRLVTAGLKNSKLDLQKARD